jgi:uncharacterized protein (DUF1778 family)
MEKRARLSLYLRDDKFRRQIKVAAAKRGLSISDYCMKAIERQLMQDGELSVRDVFAATEGYRASVIARMDRLREEIGPVDLSAAELIKEGRRR